MLKILKKDKIWLMVNIAGIVVYLAGDSYTWSEDTIPHLFKSGNIVAF